MGGWTEAWAGSPSEHKLSIIKIAEMCTIRRLETCTYLWTHPIPFVCERLLRVLVLPAALRNDEESSFAQIALAALPLAALAALALVLAALALAAARSRCFRFRFLPGCCVAAASAVAAAHAGKQWASKKKSQMRDLGNQNGFGPHQHSWPFTAYYRLQTQYTTSERGC